MDRAGVAAAALAATREADAAADLEAAEASVVRVEAVADAGRAVRRRPIPKKWNNGWR